MQSRAANGLEKALRIPEKIEITIKVGGEECRGMFAMLIFFAVQKNAHGLVFGPSGELGRIQISREQIIREAKKTIDLFPMDYRDIELEWTGVLRVTPMNRESLAGALSAFRLFCSSYEYPPGYEQSLRDADAVLTQSSGAGMTALVECEGKEKVVIDAVCVRAG